MERGFTWDHESGTYRLVEAGEEPSSIFAGVSLDDAPDELDGFVITILREDELLVLCNTLPLDDLLAFSLSCRKFNAARGAAHLPLQTSRVATLRSPALFKWAARLGCPSPFPCWAHTHGLRKKPELNDKVVRVQGPPNEAGRYDARVNARLFLQRMIREPTRPNYTTARDARAMCAKGVLMRGANLTMMQAEECATMNVFVVDAMLPRQRMRLTPENKKSFEQGNANAAERLGRMPRLGVVGVLQQYTCPLLCGVEAHIEEDADGHSFLVAGRPFEVLELLLSTYGIVDKRHWHNKPEGIKWTAIEDLPFPEAEAAFYEGAQDNLFRGGTKMFHAKVRWIPIATDVPMPRTIDEHHRKPHGIEPLPHILMCAIADSQWLDPAKPRGHRQPQPGARRTANRGSRRADPPAHRRVARDGEEPRTGAGGGPARSDP